MTKTRHEGSDMMRLLAAFAAMASLSAGAAPKEPCWKSPETTRQYLHGPNEERKIVAFREGKVLHGEIVWEHDWRRNPYCSVPAHGVWLVHGDADEAYDFRKAKLRVEPDACPIWGETWQDGDLEVDLEACSPFERVPVGHVRVRLTNRGTAAKTEKIAFLVRNNREEQLVFGAPDIYRIYNPRVKAWLGMDCFWRRDGDVLKYYDLFVAFRGDSAATWDGENGALRFEVKVAPGETRTYDLAIGRRKDIPVVDYEAARRQTKADWAKELKRIEGRSLLEKALVVQILQCYARPSGCKYSVPMQGGLQRWVWPWDQSDACAGLTLMGYGEYVEAACDFYFGEYACADGMVGPFGMGWVNDTANVLGIFSRYCYETGSEAFWAKHRDKAEKAFRWIKGQRALTKDMKGVVSGLFPPGVASDNPTVFQVWGMTDLHNVQGLDHYVRAAERFSDPVAAEASAEAKAYRAVIDRLLDICREKAKGKDTFVIPFRPDWVDEEKLSKSYFASHYGVFADLGFLSPDEVVRAYRTMLNTGVAHPNGLCFHCPNRGDPDLGEHIWYTTSQELRFYRGFRRAGRDDLAQRVKDAALRFGMTKEHLVGERYHDADPWYLPWSPNASGAGRLLQLLNDRETCK